MISKASTYLKVHLAYVSKALQIAHRRMAIGIGTNSNEMFDRYIGENGSERQLNISVINILISNLFFEFTTVDTTRRKFTIG